MNPMMHVECRNENMSIMGFWGIGNVDYIGIWRIGIH
jgi:hypothetical protein